MQDSTVKANPTLIQRFKQEAKATLKLGYPLILANLLQMSMAFVDTVMAGNLSTTDLAAVAVGSSILTPAFVFGAGILMAVTPIVSQNFGRRTLDKIGRCVRQALWLSLILSVPTILFLRNAYPILVLMQIDPDVAILAQGYLKAAAWGIPGFFFYLALKHFNEAVSVTRPAMYFALIGLFFNIFWNYTLMFGKFGFPALGAIGTGWATMIVMWVMFICIFIFTLRFKPFKRFQIFSEIRRPDFGYMKDLLKLGLPIGVTFTMEVSLFAIVTLFMGLIGTVAVGAHQIALNLASVTFMVALGLSSAVTVRVGQNLGKGSLSNARFSGYTGIILAVSLMCCTALMFFTIPELLVSMYTADPDLVELAVQLLLLAAVFQISDGLQVSGAAALRGLKDTRFPMIVNFVAYWLIGLTSGYILGIHFGWGPKGLWIGLIAGLTAAAILHNIRFWYLSHNKTIEELMEKTS